MDRVAGKLYLRVERKGNESNGTVYSVINNANLIQTHKLASWVWHNRQLKNGGASMEHSADVKHDENPYLCLGLKKAGREEGGLKIEGKKFRPGKGCLARIKKPPWELVHRPELAEGAYSGVGPALSPRPVCVCVCC